MKLCGRCGEREATTEFTWMFGGGGIPYCERCIVEVQLEHAEDMRDQIPDLGRRLEELGGRAEKIVCGYVIAKDALDPAPFGSICLLPHGHRGFHLSQ